MSEGTKIAIIGAGRVGCTCAYTLATSGLAREVVLIDSNRERAEGEAMDIAHSVAFRAPVRVVAGTIADTAGAALTVITAGAAQQAGESRPALLRRNVEVLREIIPRIIEANPDGLLLVATNPVDALTYVALRLSGLHASRVMGSGTVLDTARLRAELSLHYNVDARNVHAYVLGEHGDSEVVAWSTANLANLRFEEYCLLTGTPFTEADLTLIDLRVRNAAYEIIRRKGATNFAIATTLARIIEAVVRDQASVLTVSALIEGHYGIHNVCLSLPAVVDRSGIRRVLPVTLSDREKIELVRSASVIREMTKTAGID